ncbi:O-acetyl-ADP-ribose deacetylase (regulator of RNase III) [Stackebrandtia albiflava]|uniref:O-acetyl-ADP-ribose deacetylase (Regulator of RNase III) n=1 Tax=Stackebrandtia albiflava TaxID=406432 RepID=A0A562V0R2_9ACTN|nr:macro domain-containing protein [Stackebrandtia albiflava]TWJ11468.1 O-acetyl-ADP-ribose deacetylase (regulator of RNase III) [Stackebrandtia albiflava]
MIALVGGDLLKDDADVLVNPVNVVGVMGRGLAAQFKRAYPENFAAYRRACERGELRVGTVLAVPIPHARWVVNLPTKRHWRAASRLEDVAAGLDGLVDFLERTPVDSVAVPALGAGLGGLPWPEVEALTREKLGTLEVTVRLYAPAGT